MREQPLLSALLLCREMQRKGRSFERRHPVTSVACIMEQLPRTRTDVHTNTPLSVPESLWQKYKLSES